MTSSQLARLGWTHHAVLHLASKGLLVPVRRQVWRAAGAPPSTEMMLLAAVLAAGEGALLSHATAAQLWGFTKIPRPELIDVLVDSWSQPRHGPARPAEGHREQRPPAEDPDPAEARPHRDEVPCSGRRAIVPVVELLGTLVAGCDPGDSDPEVDLVGTLVSAGFPRPAQQIRVEIEGQKMRIDVGWPELQVGYEYDSLEYHEHRFHEDRDRLRRLKRAGWDVWPITKTTSRNEILAIATSAFAPLRAA